MRKKPISAPVRRAKDSTSAVALSTLSTRPSIEQRLRQGGAGRGNVVEHERTLVEVGNEPGFEMLVREHRESDEEDGDGDGEKRMR